MSSEAALCLDGLGKCYHIYDTPKDRLLQMLFRGHRQYYREFWALRNVSLTIGKGECFGIIGRNGSGKSTLLQLLCGTLNPSEGKVEVSGRVAALLELGAGFNPEFTGRENIFLSAAVLGLSPVEVAARYEEIVDFSGIRDFIDQPVKTYSSGMYVRLAFAVATSVDPDILVIDEALSVGDGEFSRKSFDRIIALKEAGKTILLCSHSLYQVEVFCDRVLWLDKGAQVRVGDAAEVVTAYRKFLFGTSEVASQCLEPLQSHPVHSEQGGRAMFVRVDVSMDGVVGSRLKGYTDKSTLTVRMEFVSDPSLPLPTVGATIEYGASFVVTSVLSCSDRVLLTRNKDGWGVVILEFPRLSLLRGTYQLSVYLGCERGLHIYDAVHQVAVIDMIDETSLLGLVEIEHSWSCPGN